MIRPGRFLIQALGLAISLALGVVALGRFEIQPEPRASVGFPVVFVQLPVDAVPARTVGIDGGLLPPRPGERARLLRLEPDGTFRILVPGFQSACEPDVSFDGKRLLFAGKRAASDAWNVFELELESDDVRQLTRDLGNCRSPVYLSSYYTITEAEPWDQLAFVSDAAGHPNEQGGQPATSLYTCKLDGSFVQRITYNLSSDLDPYLMPDGRLLHAAWRRARLEDGLAGRVAVEGVNVDGSDRAAFLPTRTKLIQRMPCLTGDGLVIFVEAETPTWDGAGSLACVAMRRPLHTYKSLSGPADGLYISPAPLPDGRLLVSRRAPDGEPSQHGLFVRDLQTGHETTILDDPAFHEIQARAIVTRPRPDGRSSVVSAHDPLAKLYAMDTRISDLPGPQATEAAKAGRTIRVVEGRPMAPASGPPEPTRDHGPRLAPRRILGEVPLEPDGSFHLTVPANVPIELQLLDEQGMAMRSCGWIWARSHQAQGCIGCHEDPERTPPNKQPLALRGHGQVLNPPEVERSTIDFRHEIGPIVATRCAGCHASGQSLPVLDLAGEREGELPSEPVLRNWYEALLGRGEANPAVAPAVIPGQARTSPLVWHLLGENSSRPWDGDAASHAARPIPGKQAEALPEVDKQLIIRWIDLGAAWDSRTPTPRPTPEP